MTANHQDGIPLASDTETSYTDPPAMLILHMPDGTARLGVPENIVIVNEQNGPANMLDDAATGDITEPRWVKWYHRVWDNVKSTFTRKEGTEDQLPQETNERPNSEPPLNYRRRRYRGIILGSSEGQETNWHSISDLIYTNSRYGSKIGVAGRYRSRDAEEDLGIQEGTYDYIRMRDLGCSGPTLETGHFSRNAVFSENVKIVHTSKAAKNCEIVEDNRMKINALIHKHSDDPVNDCNENDQEAVESSIHSSDDDKVTGATASVKMSSIQSGSSKGSVDPAKSYVQITNGDNIPDAGGRKSPPRREHIHIGYTESPNMISTCSSPTRSGIVGSELHVGLDHTGGAHVLDINNANVLPDGYVSVGIGCGEMESNSSGGVPSTGTTNDDDHGNTSNDDEGMESGKVSDSPSGSESVANVGTDESLTVTYIKRNLRWDRYTYLGPQFK